MFNSTNAMSRWKSIDIASLAASIDLSGPHLSLILIDEPLDVLCFLLPIWLHRKMLPVHVSFDAFVCCRLLWAIFFYLKRLIDGRISHSVTSVRRYERDRTCSFSSRLEWIKFHSVNPLLSKIVEWISLSNQLCNDASNPRLNGWSRRSPLTVSTNQSKTTKEQQGSLFNWFVSRSSCLPDQRRTIILRLFIEFASSKIREDWSDD